MILFTLKKDRNLFCKNRIYLNKINMRMKKSIFTNYAKGYHYVFLFFFLGLFCAGEVFAQESEGGGGGLSLPLKFGAKIGTTISSFTNQQPHNNIMQGLTAGLFVDYSFMDNMGVQVEFLYAQEGGRLLYFDYPNLIGKDFWYAVDAENQQLVLHNISVPILYNYNLALTNFKLGVVIGPDLGYTVSASAMKEGTVFTESGSFHTYTGSEDVSSNIEKFHVAATAGIGLKIPAGNLNLLIDVRYKYGLTPVYKSYSYVGIPQISGDLKYNAVSITCGISF
jgi:hypothetical protein